MKHHNPLYFRLEDFKLVRAIIQELADPEDMSEEEKKLLWKTEVIIGKIESAIERKAHATIMRPDRVKRTA